MVSTNGPPARIDTGIAHVAIILNGRHGRGVVGAGRCLLMRSCRECNTMENDGTYSYVYSTKMADDLESKIEEDTILR